MNRFIPLVSSAADGGGRDGDGGGDGSSQDNGGSGGRKRSFSLASKGEPPAVSLMPAPTGSSQHVSVKFTEGSWQPLGGRGRKEGGSREKSLLDFRSFPASLASKSEFLLPTTTYCYRDGNLCLSTPPYKIVEFYFFTPEIATVNFSAMENKSNSNCTTYKAGKDKGAALLTVQHSFYNHCVAPKGNVSIVNQLTKAGLMKFEDEQIVVDQLKSFHEGWTQLIPTTPGAKYTCRCGKSASIPLDDGGSTFVNLRWSMDRITEATEVYKIARILLDEGKAVDGTRLLQLLGDATNRNLKPSCHMCDKLAKNAADKKRIATKMNAWIVKFLTKTDGGEHSGA
jgi:hypothetical protein